MAKQTLPAMILGQKLRALRKEADFTQLQLGKLCRFSESKISLIESGKNPPSLFDVAGMCRVLKASGELTQHLESMADAAETPGWWEPYSTYMLKDVSMFLELEQACSELFVYESDLIAGLLQTEAYGRAINVPGPPMDNDAIEKFVALRTTRQERFWARNPLPDTCIIMQELALTRPICGSEGDAAQRRRIMEIADLPNIDIRVLPTAAGAHPSMQGAYTILTSGITEISDVVYTDSITGATYEETEEHVQSCRTFFEATRKQSIPVKEFFNGNR